MSTRNASWLAWSLWALTVALLSLSMFLNLFSPSISIAEALDLANTPDAIAVVLFTTLVLSFSTVGVLIATRQTQNPIGWIMIGGYVDLSLPQGRLPATHAVGSVGFGVGRAARHRPGTYLSLGTDS